MTVPSSLGVLEYGGVSQKSGAGTGNEVNVVDVQSVGSTLSLSQLVLHRGPVRNCKDGRLAILQRKTPNPRGKEEVTYSPAPDV